MSGRILDISDDSDDEFDPQPGGTAKLSSLFASDRPQNEGISAFTYKPPKPPSYVKVEPTVMSTTTVTSPTVNFTPSLIYACAVVAYNNKDGEFVKHGKLGCALVRSGQKEYNLLLYLSKQQPVVQVLINDQFKLTISQSYAQFEDIQGLKWSLSFDTDEALIKLVKWILAVQISFSNAAGDANYHYQIDVKLGEGNSVKLGDSVEIEFSECLIESGPKLKEISGDDRFGQVLRLKVGKGKVPKGWESGLIGMCKNGLRVFATGGISPTLVAVNLKRIKFAKSAEVSVDDKSEIKNGTIAGDVSVVDSKLPHNLLELCEADVPLPSVEADNSIRTRMAKIGQPVLKPTILTAKPNQMAVFCATVTVPSNVVTTTESHKLPSAAANLDGISQTVMSTSTSTTSSAEHHNWSPCHHPQQTYQMPNFYFPPWMFPPYNSKEPHNHGDLESSAFLKELRESQEQLKTSIISQFTASLNKMTEEVLEGVDRKLNRTENKALTSEESAKLQTDLASVRAQLNVPKRHDSVGTVVGDVSEKLELLMEKFTQAHSSNTPDDRVENQLSQQQLSTVIRSEKSKADMPEHIKVRRILNNFYKRLSGQFAPDEVYSGDEIRQFAISAIKEATKSPFQPDRTVGVGTESTKNSDVFLAGLEKVSDRLVAEALEEFIKFNNQSDPIQLL